MTYVFNYLQADDCLFRAPKPLAHVVCVIAERWFGRTWDYAAKPEGL